ncbi:MAG: MerR family transcriptional regulator [Deltaproteobacteria bacterium]|nr:MerR family transcriptional regulator [Deltaproteobacteria bacterium]
MGIKPSERPSSGENESPMLKMKELMEATGVTKATILHYVQEGLLPESVKTSRNMAYYTHTCIEKISFIKQLQSKHRIGLSQIKAILEERDKGREVTPLIEMKEVVFGQSSPQHIDKKTFCRVTGLSSAEVDKYLSEDLLIPKEEGRFDPEDVAIGRILRLAGELGIKPEEAEYYPRLAEEIVGKEMAIHTRLVKDRPYEEAINVTMDLTRVARSLRAYIIDRVFQKRALSQEVFDDKTTDEVR